MHSHARGNLCSVEDARSDQLASSAFFLSKWRSMKREPPLLLWFWFSMQLAPWHVDQLKGMLKWPLTRKYTPLWNLMMTLLWMSMMVNCYQNSAQSSLQKPPKPKNQPINVAFVDTVHECQKRFWSADVPCLIVPEASGFTAHVCWLFWKTNRALLCRGRD